jgi:hypothetical protein
MTALMQIAEIVTRVTTHAPLAGTDSAAPSSKGVRACLTRGPAAKVEARSRKAARRPARAPAPKRSSSIGCSVRWHKRPPAVRQQGKQVPYGWDLQHLRVRRAGAFYSTGEGRSDVPDRGEQYDVRCLMYGTEVGPSRLAGSSSMPAARDRCRAKAACRAAGTVAARSTWRRCEGYLPATDDGRLDRMPADEAGRPSGRRRGRPKGGRASSAA